MKKANLAIEVDLAKQQYTISLEGDVIVTRSPGEVKFRHPAEAVGGILKALGELVDEANALHKQISREMN